MNGKNEDLEIQFKKEQEETEKTVKLEEEISPEEKEKTEIENSINELSAKAEKHIQEIEKQKAEIATNKKMEMEAEINANPPVVTNMKSVKQELKDNEFYKNKLKQRLEKEEVDLKLAPLIYYLEHNADIKDYKWKKEWINKGDVEEVLDYHQVEGRKARKTGKKSFLRKKEEVEVKKEEIPYIVSSKKEYENLAKLIEGSNDPIETIERLKRIGINIEGDTLKTDFEVFNEFVSQSGICEVLKGLNSLDFRAGKKVFDKNEAFYQYLNEFSQNPNKLKLFEKENLKELLRLEKNLGSNFFQFKNTIGWDEDNFKNVENLLQAASDKNIGEIVDYVIVNLVNLGDKYIKTVNTFYLSKNLLSLQKLGLLPEITEFTKSILPEQSFSLIEKLLTKNNLSYFNKEQWQDAFQQILYSPETEKLRANPKLNSFIKKIFAITGQKFINYEEIRAFENLYLHKNQKEILALYELNKEWNCYSSTVEIEYLLNKVEICKNKTMFKPEFVSFAKELFDTGFSIELNGLTNVLKKLKEIRSDEKLKNDLTNEETISFLKDVHKKFNLHFNLKIQNVISLISVSKDADFRKLLENDQTVKFIKNSLSKFDLEFSTIFLIKNISSEFYPLIGVLSDSFDFKVEIMDWIRLQAFIENLEVIKENQTEILPILIKFRDLGWLNKEIIEQDGNDLKNIARNKTLQEKIFNSENVDFIKSMITDKTIMIVKDIKTISLMEENKKNAIKQILNDFRVKLHPYEIYNDYTNSSILASLIHNQDIQKEITENNLENYRIRTTQEIVAKFLYEGDTAHNYLETIKEKGWITIQTYNRLYAARRSLGGFESYPYFCKVGNLHPTINVTYYEMNFGADTFINKKRFTVDTQNTDENGFYNGKIGDIAIKIYPKTYKIYEAAIKKYKNLDKKNQESFWENFSWYDRPKKFKEGEDKELEFVINNTLPLGAAPNGHSHFYFTPYGIISGCVSQAKEQTGILKEDHYAAKGVGIVTGHKEMLLDFLKSKEMALSLEKKPEVIPPGAITIQFKNLQLSEKLEQMVLPPNITLGEMILNLHLEQYLHSELKPDRVLLDSIMKQLEKGEVVAKSNEKILKLDDKILPDSVVMIGFK